MDPKRARIELIRQRHRELILEPRRKMEYALVDDWDEEPLFKEDGLAGKFAQLTKNGVEEE